VRFVVGAVLTLAAGLPTPRVAHAAPQPTRILHFAERTSMSIRATVDHETKELILFVDREGLESLVSLLRSSDSSAIPLTSGPAAPLTYPIATLAIRRDSGDLVDIKTDDDSAAIAGNAAALAHLARGDLHGRGIQ
jgi:hypothetical protein